MRTLLVSYDLVGTDETSQDYKKLIEAIKAYPNWAKVNKSVWIIRTSQSCAAVRDALLGLMDDNDRLFVVRLYREAAWHRPLCDNDWLLTNLQD